MSLVQQNITAVTFVSSYIFTKMFCLGESLIDGEAPVRRSIINIQKLLSILKNDLENTTAYPNKCSSPVTALVSIL